MLYWLSFLSDKFSFLNVFRYITFRTGGAIFLSFFICLIVGSLFHPVVKIASKRGQPIRSDGRKRICLKKEHRQWAA